MRYAKHDFKLLTKEALGRQKTKVSSSVVSKVKKLGQKYKLQQLSKQLKSV
jgi:hypothetical protein